jgi:hypothetical protein
MNAIAAPAFSGWRRTVIENVAMPAAATDTMILGARQDELEGRARGHLVPLSYFMAEVNSGKSQPTHANTPGRFSLFSGLEPGRSVPSSRSTLNWAGLKRFAIPVSIALEPRWPRVA